MRFTTITALVTLLSSGLAMASSFSIDSKESKAEWIGKKVTGQHNGFLKFKGGSLDIEDDKLKGGSFVIDMNSITVADLEGEWADKLLNHLKNDDFFATNKHPTSTFKISSVSNVGSGDYLLKGDLTIKGKTNPASLNVKVSINDGKLDGKGTLKFDRTKWGIEYKSGKFFENLGDKLIYDEVEVEVKIVAKQ